VRRIDLVGNGARTASLLLVLAEGPVRQTLVSLDDPLGQDDLNSLAATLDAELADCDATAVEERLQRLDETHGHPRVLRRIGERVVQLMREFDAATVEDLFSEGLLNVMDAPEFARSEQVSRVFRLLQDRQYLGGLVVEVARLGGVQVYIGTENGPSEMHDVSLVLASYGRPGGAMGVVGVLGPTRMAYPHAISSVRYVSGLMNELVDQLYA
jgi:heat-inducible transcriptional repressor